MFGPVTVGTELNPIKAARLSDFLVVSIAGGLFSSNN